MPHALQSLSTSLMDGKARIRRGDLSVLSRQSDAAWKDHGHRPRSSTPRRSALTTQRAGICVHSNVPAYPPLRRSTRDCPAPPLWDHFWERSPLAPASVVPQSSQLLVLPHPADRQCPSFSQSPALPP